jgi:hypothetical protein
MNAAEFKALAFDRLARLEEAESEDSATDPRNADRFIALFNRWEHAKIAFPGMTWEEFLDADRRRNARRGRRKDSELTKGSKPLVRAARDVKRIRDLWLEMAGTKRGIPVDPIEIAAARHGVDEAELGELVRRPLSRR